MALDDGKGGVYAELAALRLAKAQMDAGKTAEAIKTLRDVPAEGSSSRSCSSAWRAC